MLGSSTAEFKWHARWCRLQTWQLSTQQSWQCCMRKVQHGQMLTAARGESATSCLQTSKPRHRYVFSGCGLCCKFCTACWGTVAALRCDKSVGHSSTLKSSKLCCAKFLHAKDTCSHSIECSQRMNTCQCICLCMQLTRPASPASIPQPSNQNTVSYPTLSSYHC